MNQLLLSVSQTAELIGMSRWFVAQLCRSGALAFIPLGRKHKRISRAEIDRWIRDSQITNGSKFRRAVDGRRS